MLSRIERFLRMLRDHYGSIDGILAGGQVVPLPREINQSLIDTDLDVPEAESGPFVERTIHLNLLKAIAANPGKDAKTIAAKCSPAYRCGAHVRRALSELVKAGRVRYEGYLYYPL